MDSFEGIPEDEEASFPCSEKWCNGNVILDDKIDKWSCSKCYTIYGQISRKE